MFSLFGNKANKISFKKTILRKNNISLLILDERWNKLFTDTQKTPRIASCEEKLKELLKEEARLTAENKEITAAKKQHMDKIIQLTPEVFEKSNEEAMKEMVFCETEIKRINSRMKKIETELEVMPDRMKSVNLELLENTVKAVYLKIRSSSLRVKELEGLIEETRTKLKAYIDEKESMAQADIDIYAYFHDLLGGEELERLDGMFFKEKGK